MATRNKLQARRRAMKAYTVKVAVLVAGAAIMMAGSVFAGQTQAERERALRQRADPESALGWQVRPALDTGSLPVGNAVQPKSEGVAKAGIPTVEIGGKVYRIGIDTP
jgi:hypothetical protein